MDAGLLLEMVLSDALGFEKLALALCANEYDIYMAGNDKRKIVKNDKYYPM